MMRAAQSFAICVLATIASAASAQEMGIDFSLLNRFGFELTYARQVSENLLRANEILSFTGFDDGESASFGLDPDTWSDPSYGATRGQMAGCSVEVVFVEAGGLRAAGSMVLQGDDSVRADATQTHP